MIKEILVRINLPHQYLERHIINTEKYEGCKLISEYSNIAVWILIAILLGQSKYYVQLLQLSMIGTPS